ncbi:MAG: lysophospholipase, partial [Treponema sp.]|nr:lysophospholipase [Treponema sp.]
MKWIPMDDGVKLYLNQWPTETSSDKEFRPRAVVHIVHGMAEHSQRYEWVAQKLNSEGIEVWAADQRGHGKTADPAVNDPGKGGLLGHCYDGDGFARVTADIDAINRLIRKERPGLPLFILGHSWGSFITQNYIETYGGLFPGVPEPIRLSGCILSGTRGPGDFVEKLGRPVANFIAFIKGGRKGSKFIRGMADGPYNKPFRPNRTGADWLSRDNNIVDICIKDPLCGKLCSSGFYRDLVNGLKRIHQKEALERIPKDLPIYMFSGSADPVGGMGESPTALVNIYRSMGIRDLDFILYPDARHETLNETNREEVVGNL